MTADNTLGLWLCSSDGLWKFNREAAIFLKIIHKNNDPNYHPLCLYAFVDHQQNVWAGFWNTGLKKYDVHTRQLTDFGTKLPNHTVSCIREIKRSGDNNYALWLDGNLLAFDETSNSYFRFEYPLSGKELPSLNPIYRSKDGWLWLGSDKGLYIYNPQRQLFNHSIFTPSITSQGISFYNYGNGILAGAEQNNFLKWRDKNGNLLKDFSFLGKDAALLCIKESKPDEFWMGTTEGILHANLKTGNKSWFKHIDGDSTSLPRNFISCLFIDSKENLWVFPWVH